MYPIDGGSVGSRHVAIAKRSKFESVSSGLPLPFPVLSRCLAPSEPTLGMRAATVGKLEIRCQLKIQSLAESEQWMKRTAGQRSRPSADLQRHVPMVGTVVRLDRRPNLSLFCRHPSTTSSQTFCPEIRGGGINTRRESTRAPEGQLHREETDSCGVLRSPVGLCRLWPDSKPAGTVLSSDFELLISAAAGLAP